MKTSDVYLSAALLALGYKLEKVDRKDPRHMVFEFAYPKDEEAHAPLDDIEKEWANRTLTGNFFDFSEAIKRMKSVIHSS